MLKFVEVLKINSEDEESGCCVFVTEIIVSLALDLNVKLYLFY